MCVHIFMDVYIYMYIYKYIYIYIYTKRFIYIYIVSWLTIVEGDLKDSFSIANTGEDTTPFPGLLHLTLMCTL